MMTDDHFHLDSLNEFTMELTVAGFEPVDGSRPLRWRGRIHPAFSSLTDAAMMDVVIRPGWPFQSPAVVVEGLNTNHSTLGGYVCMWHDDDSSLEWTTVGGLFSRIEEWCENAKSGWENDPLDQDAFLNFKLKNRLLATFDLPTFDLHKTGDAHYQVKNTESVKEWCTLALPDQRRLAMTLDFDAFLTALYTIVDDLYKRHYGCHKPVRPGRRPVLSDSEVLTLMLCCQWFGTSERAFVRHVSEHWRGYFPNMLTQSAFNRRSRDLCGVVIALSGAVAEELGACASAYQAIDSVPVPLARMCRGDRHRLFGDESAIGKGGSDRRFYYGCKLLLSVSRRGVITGFLIAPASTEDRWVAESFLCWRNDWMGIPRQAQDLPIRRNGNRYVGATGPIWPRYAVGRPISEPYLGDNGFFGSLWQTHWRQQYGARVLTPKNYVGSESELARRRHCSLKQVVETVNGQLEEVFGLQFPRARSKWGLLSRVAAKVAALNVGIWLNRHFGRPDLALATLFNC